MTRLGWAALLAVAVGCSERGPRAEEFVPAEAVARAALDASLRAWMQGEASSPVVGADPPVEVADGLRTKGRTLVRYEILGPVPADAPRCFAVRLTLGNPTQELRERYVVLGLNPLWVWRHDDYVMLTHWDHTMTADPAKKTGPAPKR